MLASALPFELGTFTSSSSVQWLRVFSLLVFSVALVDAQSVNKPDGPTEKPGSGIGPKTLSGTAATAGPAKPRDINVDPSKLRANIPPYRIERKAFGANEFFNRVEIFRAVMPPSGKPRAFLLLATDMAKPRTSIEDKAWASFAIKQQFGIVSLGFDEVEPLRRPQEAASDLSKRIINLVEEAYGPNLRGAIFATGPAASMLHRVISREPWRWGFWCTRDANGKYPLLPRGIAYPAGLMVATIPSHYDEDLFFFQEIRRVKVENRAGFLTLDGKTMDGAFLDRIGQNYLLAVMGGGGGSGLSYDLRTKEDCAKLEKKPSPIMQVWIPDEEIAGAWKMLHQAKDTPPGPTLASANIELPELAKTVKVFFRIPGKVKQGIPVRTVMLWTLWEQKDEDVIKRLQSASDFNAALWDRERVGVIAFNIKPLGIPEKVTSGDLERTEQVAKIVSPAFWKVVGNAAGELGWPRGGYALFGSAAGSAFAQSMAYVEPARFNGVHLHASLLYLPPKAGMEQLGWVVTSGGKHEGHAASVAFYHAAKKAGWPIVFRAPAGGAGTLDAWVMALNSGFFSTLRDLGDQIRKEVAEGKRPATDTGAKVLEAQFKQPFVIADLTSGKVVLPEKASEIPEVNQVPLPSAYLAEYYRLGGAPVPPAAEPPPVKAAPSATAPKAASPPAASGPKNQPTTPQPTKP